MPAGIAALGKIATGREISRLRGRAHDAGPCANFGARRGGRQVLRDILGLPIGME